MTDAELTRRLARFAAGTTYDDVDEEARAAARKALVDTLGAAYLGTTTDEGRTVREYARTLGDGPATLLGTGGGDGATARAAALANGTAAHARDVDDGHRAGSVHPGSPTVPAALAVAEREGADGEALLAALVVGYEATIRTAEAMQPSHRERGFHATATCGCVGAAAAVASLLDLDAEATAHALGLGGTQAGGLFEFLATGSAAKRLHPGRAAAAGVRAADLAARGFDGPPTILEGEDGLFGATADEWDAAPFDALGDPFAVTESYLKPYPCCRHLHGPIEAALDLRERVAAADVETVRVETYGIAARHDAREVRTLMDAQMSIPYAVGVAYETGAADLPAFDPPGDPSLSSRVEVVETDGMNALYPDSRPARVVVETGDDRHEVTVREPLGSAARPLSAERVREKFRDLSREALAADAREDLLDALSDPAALADVRDLPLR